MVPFKTRISRINHPPPEGRKPRAASYAITEEPACEAIADTRWQKPTCEALADTQEPPIPEPSLRYSSVTDAESIAIQMKAFAQTAPTVLERSAATSRNPAFTVLPRGPEIPPVVTERTVAKVLFLAPSRTNSLLDWDVYVYDRTRTAEGACTYDVYGGKAAAGEQILSAARRHHRGSERCTHGT